MLTVRFTPDAKVKVTALFAHLRLAKPGLIIQRLGPSANVTRSSGGDVEWNIEYQHPWQVLAADFQGLQDNEDIYEFEGIRVWLSFSPKQEQKGLEVSVRNGELFVDQIHV